MGGEVAGEGGGVSQHYQCVPRFVWPSDSSICFCSLKIFGVSNTEQNSPNPTPTDWLWQLLHSLLRNEHLWISFLAHVKRKYRRVLHGALFDVKKNKKTSSYKNLFNFYTRTNRIHIALQPRLSFINRLKTNNWSVWWGRDGRRSGTPSVSLAGLGGWPATLPCAAKSPSKSPV